MQFGHEFRLQLTSFNTCLISQYCTKFNSGLMRRIRMRLVFFEERKHGWKLGSAICGRCFFMRIVETLKLQLGFKAPKNGMVCHAELCKHRGGAAREPPRRDVCYSYSMLSVIPIAKLSLFHVSLRAGKNAPSSENHTPCTSHWLARVYPQEPPRE